MLEQDLKESRLQQWFSAVAADRDIMSNIQPASLAEFQRRCAAVNSDRRQATRLRREGLIRAQKICNFLPESDLVTENKNIARVTDTRMHPDLVLTSQAGNYILVELKTQRNAERQGVQELLAYYAALRQQMPYANEFIFIVVAVHWDELLTQAVKALVLDGKHVLPLRVHPGAAVEFSLSIELPVFEFNLEQVYNPLQALMPAELGVSIPVKPWKPMHAVLNAYRRYLVHRSVAAARQRGLSGFCLSWSHQTGNSSYQSVLLVTVNQQLAAP